VTETNRPSKPLFASREDASPAQSGNKNGRGRQRLSVSLILLLASLTVGGITVWWSGFYAESENISISLETVSKTPADQLQMTGARYSGVSASGLKFNIEADKVIERSDQAGVVHLFKPDGWIESDLDGKTTLFSEEAIYNADAAILDMTGNVQIHQKQQDMVLKSQQMTALIDSGDLKTNMPVSLTGPAIELTAQGMESQNRGEVILFKGQTQARLMQTTQDGDK